MGKSLVPAAQASATPESSPKAPRFPPVGMYGVMQINLSAMVQHLHDEDVLARASCVEMKKYLVYIRQFGELPFHSSPWCRYSVSFIEVRIRAKPGGYDEDRAVKQTIPEHISLVKIFSDDCERMEMNEMAFKEAFATVVASPPVEFPEPDLPSEDVPLEDGTDVVDDERPWASSPAFSEEPLPDVFGLEHDPNIEARIPLVDLWSDLENHISADAITDPREFEEEVRQVQSIVDEAIGRLYEAGKSIPDPRHFAQNAQLHAVPPSDTAPGQVGGTKSTATAVVGGDTNKPRPNPKMSDFLGSLLRSLGQRLFGRIHKRRSS